MALGRVPPDTPRDTILERGAEFLQALHLANRWDALGYWFMRSTITSAFLEPISENIARRGLAPARHATTVERAPRAFLSLSVSTRRSRWARASPFIMGSSSSPPLL